MSYIEPCCCERQLPRLLREQKMAFFTTSGDVLVSHLMKSVGCMVDNGCTMWLIAERVDVPLMRRVRHWFAQRWVNRLWLLTKEDCEEVVTGEMGAAMASQHTGQEVMYGKDETVDGGMLAFSDGKKTVAVQGEMLMEVKKGMKMYAGCFGSADGDRVKGAMEAVVALMKARCRKVGEGGAAVIQQHTEQGAEEEITEQEETAEQEGTAGQAQATEKKKRTRRMEGKKESTQ